MLQKLYFIEDDIGQIWRRNYLQVVNTISISEAAENSVSDTFAEYCRTFQN